MHLVAVVRPAYAFDGFEYRMSETTGVIERSRSVLGGVPVFRGTRVPVRTLMDYLEAGERLDDFIADFPTVSREQAVRALELAKDALLTDAHPSG